MAEHLFCKQDVGSSILPLGSMKSKPVLVVKLTLLTWLTIMPMVLIPRLIPQPTYSTSLTNASSPAAVDTQSKSSQFAVLVANDLITPSLESEINQSEIIPSQIKPSATGKNYRVAVLGDSMIQTMGEGLPHLTSALKKYYPEANFTLLNYGIGATDIESGQNRLPTILSQNPDVVVVESFAYNHWNNTLTDLNRQWLTLAKMIDTIKSQSQAKIILAAVIAPDQNTLCDGIEGINLISQQKWEKAQTIKAYLQNVINFSQSQNLPLADAYHASLDKNGNGKAVYVNAGDHLHPSAAGHTLLSEKIAEAIFRYNLI